MNAKEIMDLGEKTLRLAGIEDAKNDSRLLLEFIKGMDKNKLFTIWATEQDEKSCNKYFELIDMRASRIPLQHITGQQQFMDFMFKVERNVLIPRQETELLVEKVLEYCESNGKALNVLDLCCGSGVIGISIDKMYKKAKVVCSDIDKNAIALTKLNKSTLKSKVDIKESNMFKAFKGKLANKKFDIIVSNPPYIPSFEIENLQPEVKNHEPRLALDGGSSGLVFYETILSEAEFHLKKDGMLFLEIGYDQGLKLKEMAESKGIFEDIKIEKDLSGLDRIFMARKK